MERRGELEGARSGARGARTSVHSSTRSLPTMKHDHGLLQNCIGFLVSKSMESCALIECALHMERVQNDAANIG
jgi:hypothetical protein